MSTLKSAYEDVTMPFGKHEGELLDEIPTSYLKWLLDAEIDEEEHPELEEAVEAELGYRDDHGTHF